MITRHPFSKFIYESIDPYIKSGNDINLKYDNQHILEYLTPYMKRSPVDLNIIQILSYENCFIADLPLNADWLKLVCHVDFNYRNLTEKEQSTFINRFIFAHKNENKFARKMKHTTPWLHHFLNGDKTYPLFLWAEKYHPNFSEEIKKIHFWCQENIWFQACRNAFCYSETHLNIHRERLAISNNILDILISYYPEGINWKDQNNETVVQKFTNLLEEQKHDSPGLYKENTALVHKLLTLKRYCDLNQSLTATPANTPKQKI